MAIHTSLSSMSKEAIDEYLEIARYCVSTEKHGGGVYGYPAVLLLFSLIDAFGNYQGYPKHSFLAMKDIFAGVDEKKAKQMGHWYRHLTAHQAIIMPGTMLTTDQGNPLELNADDEPTHIRIVPFYEAIAQFWLTFDKGKINPKFIAAAAPTNPVDVSNRLTASGLATTSSCPTVGITATIKPFGKK